MAAAEMASLSGMTRGQLPVHGDQRSALMQLARVANRCSPRNDMAYTTRSPRTLWGKRLEQMLEWVPGLLDTVASQKDVASVSLALQRVVEEDQHHVISRHQSSPAIVLMGRTEEGSPEKGGESGKQRARQVLWLVFLFVMLDTSKSLAVSWAAVNGQMCAPLVICAKDSLSIFFGMVVATVLDGPAGLRECLHLRRSLRVLPIAGSFCAAQIFALQALRAFDAGSLKVISQLNLPITTVLSWLVLRRRYSVQQWIAMALLLNVTMAFLQVRMLFFDPPKDWEFNAAEEVTRDKALAMFHFLVGIGISCCASIFAEGFLKTRYSVPFYIQKTNMMFGELVTAVLMVHFGFDSHGRTDACSWDNMWGWRQFPVILVWFIHGWVAGLLVKRCSAIVKNVSHIASTLVTYFLPLLVSNNAVHRWPVTICALLVLVAVLVYATAPQPPKTGRKSSSRPKVVKSHSNVDVPHMSKSSSDEMVRRAEHERRRQLKYAARQPLAEVALARNDVLPLPAKASSSSFSTCSVHSIGFLVLSFILLDATKPILVTWAHQRRAPAESFINGTFTLVQTMLSLLVGLAIAASASMCDVLRGNFLHPEWRVRVHRCLDFRSVLEQLPVSFCLCLSKLCLVMALERLDAGTVRVFGQSSLPLVGVSSAIFFSRRYSAQQWCSLVGISVALVTFYYVKAEVAAKKEALDRPIGRGVEMAGVLLVLGSITFNLSGAVLVESFLKGHRGRLHEQKAHLLLGEVFVNAVLVFVVPLFLDQRLREVHSPWHRGFFAGWDHRVFICAVVWIPAGWTATMLVKRCSNLLKTISQATSSVLTYVFSVFPVTLVGPPLTPEPLSSPVVLLAIAVMFAALSFGTDSRPSGDSGQARRHSAVAEKKGTASAAEAASVAKWALDGSYSQKGAYSQKAVGA